MSVAAGDGLQYVMRALRQRQRIRPCRCAAQHCKYTKHDALNAHVELSRATAYFVEQQVIAACVSQARMAVLLS